MMCAMKGVFLLLTIYMALVPSTTAVLSFVVGRNGSLARETDQHLRRLMDRPNFMHKVYALNYTIIQIGRLRLMV